MMIRNLIPVIALSLGLLLPAAWGQPSLVYLDFDDDDDPWTIRTEVPGDVTEALVRVILEVGDTVPAGQSFNLSIGYGCCEEGDAVYFGTSGLPNMYAYDGFFPEQPQCMWGCVDPPGCPGVHCFFNCDFVNDLNVEPGERYFMGEGIFRVVCESQPCTPPTVVDYWAYIGGEPAGSGTLTFSSGPTPAASATWGHIKSLYR